MDEAFRTILESVDREIAFFRRRAGQVFFFGLLVEAFILTGKGQINMPVEWTWQRPFVESLFFLAVLAVGVSLGSEYRRRIRLLKRRRRKLFDDHKIGNVFPELKRQILSEIEVLYVSLFFLSSAGILISWLQYNKQGSISVIAIFLSAITVFLAVYWILKCLVTREQADVQPTSSVAPDDKDSV